MRAAILVFVSLFYGSHGAADDLYVNVRWAIFHEGCNVFDVRAEAGDENLLPVAQRRACFLAVQKHNPEASQMIANATDDNLDDVTRRATEEIPKAFDLREHLRWVMDHEGQRGAFRRLVRTGEYATIRFVYRRLQNHNDNARNLLAAISNTQLRDLVLEIDRSLEPDPSRNPFTGRADDLSVTVPAIGIPDDTLTRLQRLTLERSRPESWTSKRAPVGGHLDTVVQKLYGTQSETFTRQLAELVQRASQLSGPFVSPGQELRAPSLPVRPVFPTADIAQIINTRTGQVTTRELKSGEALPFEAGGRAASFLVVGDPRDVDFILRQFPSDITAKAYTGPTYETVTLIPQQDSPTPSPCGSQPPAAASTPASEAGGLYFVVDFFKKTDKEPCPHGAMVMDVLAEQFRRAGKPELASRIVPIEADYYRNKKELNMYLDAYVSRSDPAHSASIEASVKYHKQRDPKKEKIGRFETPIIYLQAVYDHILQHDRAYIVSSSFFTAGTEHSLFPPSFKSNRRVLMLAAVTDDPGNVEDYQLEPIRTFYTMRRDAGVLLVGALLKDSKSFGMTSQAGDGVSCVGDGEGWGNDKTCIKPSERGTSFATPGVGAALFLSQLATACGTPTATEWRDRALRTVKIVPGIAGRYVAPGVPQIQWMAITAPAMVINASDQATGIPAPTGTITYSTADGTSTSTTQFGRNESRVSAVQRAGGRWYLFFEATGRWQEVTVSAIDLKYTTSTGSRPITVSDFDKQLKGVIVL